MSNYDYRDHETPYGIVEEQYNEYDKYIYQFTLYRPKDQTEPLTITQTGEIIETLIEHYDDFTYSTNTYLEEIPINLPLEIAKFQAQLMQQKYKYLDD